MLLILKVTCLIKLKSMKLLVESHKKKKMQHEQTCLMPSSSKTKVKENTTQTS